MDGRPELAHVAGTGTAARPVGHRAAYVVSTTLDGAPVVRVGGLLITALSREAWSLRIVAEALKRRREGRRVPLFLSSGNGNVISMYARDAAFRALLDTADAIDADGQPVVLASKWLTKTPIPERAATTDTFHDIARVGAPQGVRFFLLGGHESVNAKAAMSVVQGNPGLVLAGRRNGYFSHNEEDAIVAQINAARPDILWVGLGVPHEHAFVVRNRARLTDVGVIKTCGGLFDFVAGKHSRAPQWMQALSLEWAYRLYQEPRRLFWRYLTTNVHSIILMAARTGDVKAARPISIPG
jgi:N-acetylglucosaminyldiphosphoundecaprenol N-acetyl-beta-D-mannosaminyltransferase